MLSLRLLLGLPSYLFGVGLMYWCFELATLCGFVRFWQLGPRRNDVSAAVRFLKWAFKFRVLRLGRNEVYRGRCMYLVNHRCWADFFIDMYVVGCRGVPLSRRAVGMAFPAFTSSLLSLRSILLFNRAKTQDKDKFNSWLDRELSKGPQNCLLVYPEGKRSQQNTSLPLKRGMLHYAYTRKLPVQAVVTSNKEEVLNESRMWAHFGRTLVTGSSEVLESSRFDDFESFMAAVQALWDAQWQAVHSAPQHGLPELPEPVTAGGEYSGNQLAAQSASLIFWMAVMVGLGRIVLRVLAALAAHSLVGRCVVAALVLHVVASLLAAALLPPPAKRSRRSSNGASVASGSAVGASSESEKEL